MYKTETKDGIKMFRATNFAIAKLGCNKEKSNIAIALFKKN